MDQITNILYWLSTGLLVPVTIFLILFFIRALIMIGGFYGVYINRNKTNVKINRQIGSVSVADLLDHIADYDNNRSLIVSYIIRIKQYRENPVMLDKIIGDYEIASDRELGKSKFLAKIGPMLGLLGTLIPMGPALVGLATGDTASMANNMQVAFSTTVVGVVIGAIGFITLQVKQRWVADDMNILEYIVESIKQDKDDTQA